ncbi:MAG TPA: universal stress protein [Steroidobacteraceae bacterium]|nr:universal stress protein [Steroidobacteraceae bacterium]
MPIPYRKIVVPLDESSLAEAAIAHAMYLAPLSGAEVLLLEVVPRVEDVVGPIQERISIDEQSDGLRARAADYLAAVSRREGWGSTRVRTAVETGNAAEIIIGVAAREQADLVAMSTHGLSGAQRWMLGSVAEKVVLAASMPVLLIRVHPR